MTLANDGGTPDKEVLSSIEGIVFLGVPHRGSGLANLASFLLHVAGSIPGLASTVNSNFVHALERDSAQLLNISEQWVHRSTIPIYTFYETASTSTGPIRQIVSHIY